MVETSPSSPASQCSFKKSKYSFCNQRIEGIVARHFRVHLTYCLEIHEAMNNGPFVVDVTFMSHSLSMADLVVVVAE